MHDHDDALNVKVILLAVGGAALAAVLVALARREDDTPRERAEKVVAEAGADVKKEAKKAAKAARKMQKEAGGTVSKTAHHIASEVKETAATFGGDTRSAERDLKAAAWDAQQQAKEAESRLLAAGHRVVDDAAHLASRVGAEARSLAGEGKERISHLRRQDDAESETDRLRAEIAELKARLEGSGKKAERDYLGLAARFTGKGSAARDDMASQAAAAALSQLERSLKAKAPALMAARNRAQVMEILQKDLGPTLRESAVQAAMAALGMWEAGKDRAHDAADEVRVSAHDLRRETGDEVRRAEERAAAAARDTAEAAERRAESIAANGKRRLWRASHDTKDEAAAEAKRVEDAARAAETDLAAEAHHGKAGLFWGGAGLGLALYALLDAERRDKVLRLANEASVQVQELVRDLQGYDDEF